MSKCKGCPFWKWVKADRLYQAPGYHFCEKGEHRLLCKIRKEKMTKADQRALEAYPEDISYSTVLERPFDYNGHQRMIFQKGYEQAEKDTIEKAVAWLKDNANKYIVDITETYPDAPVNIIVGGMCWEDLTKYLKEK